MSNDLLMIRGEPKDGFNLSIGDPIMLQRAYEVQAPYPLPHSKLTYPPFGGSPELIQLLKEYHGNGYGYVVIANGCKQALLATAYALKKLTGATTLHHRAPYWPSYPTIAELSGLAFSSASIMQPSPTTLTFNATPGNPDGSEIVNICDVWDASYAHALYGSAGSPAHQVACWSAAKLFGMSGIRVGWLTTNNAAIAQLAAEYVEKTTSGVSTDAQNRLARVVDYVNILDFSQHYQKARAALLHNADVVGGVLWPWCTKGEGLIGDRRGMFAYVTVDDPEHFDWALARAKVAVVPGIACGGNYGQYRISCGQNRDYTEAAMSALMSALIA